MDIIINIFDVSRAIISYEFLVHLSFWLCKRLSVRNQREVEQIPPSKLVLDHGDFTGATRRHEVRYIDHTRWGAYLP